MRIDVIQLTELVRSVKMAQHSEERLELFDKVISLVETKLLWFLECICPSEFHDIAQMALLDAWNNIDQLKDPHSFWPWLAKIAKNLALKELEKKKRGVVFNCDPSELEMYALIALKDHSEETLTETEINEMFAAFSTLSPQEQQIVTLRTMNRHSWEDVGNIVNMDGDAARMKYNRALEKLREKLIRCQLQKIQ